MGATPALWSVIRSRSTKAAKSRTRFQVIGMIRQLPRIAGVIRHGQLEPHLPLAHHRVNLARFRRVIPGGLLASTCDCGENPLMSLTHRNGSVNTAMTTLCNRLPVRIASVLLAASAGMAVAGTGTAHAATPARAVHIHIVGSRRCMTAPRERPGTVVRAEKCAASLGQRWIIGGGAVRLAGSKLRMVISRRSWKAVLVLPASPWRDDWTLSKNGRHLQDLTLSKRFKADEVLTLPDRLNGKPLPGAVLRVGQLLPVIKKPGFVQNQGYQRVRASR